MSLLAQARKGEYDFAIDRAMRKVSQVDERYTTDLLAQQQRLGNILRPFVKATDKSLSPQDFIELLHRRFLATQPGFFGRPD